MNLKCVLAAGLASLAMLISIVARAEPRREHQLGGVETVLTTPTLLEPPQQPVARLRSRVSRRSAGLTSDGSTTAAVIQHWSLECSWSQTRRLTVVSSLELERVAVERVMLPCLDGRGLQVGLDQPGVWPARYVLGQGAAGPAAGTPLALPAIGLVLTNGQTLGLALDPFCGVAFQRRASENGRPATGS